MTSVLEGYAPADSPFLLAASPNGKPRDAIKKYLPLPDKFRQSAVAISGTATKDHSEIYRSVACPTGLKSALVPSVTTVPEVFQASVQDSPDANAFAYRKYDYDTGESAPELTYFTYSEVDKLAKSFGSGLLYLLGSNPFKDSTKHESHAKIDSHHSNYKNFNPDNHSFILSIFSANRYEWILTDYTCASYSITNTALYDTLGAQASEYILELTDSPVIAASKDKVNGIIDLKAANAKELGQVILVISFDPLFAKDKPLVEKAKAHGIVVVDLNQVVKIGEIFPVEPMLPSPDALYTISFTSGTTGSNPKGVMLTHRAAAAGIAMVVSANDSDFKTSFCFLPLAHIYERQMSWGTLIGGGTIAFPILFGSPLTLIDELKIVKPQVLSNVPRVYAKFEAALKAGTIESNSAIKRAIFGRVFATKQELQARNGGDPGAHLIYDIILAKFRKLLGLDNVEIMVTGSAPIQLSTIVFLKAALNVGIAQGYGLTETFAGFSITDGHEAVPNTCGPTNPYMEVRVKALPDMNYNLDDEGGPRGELLVRGPQLFSGYFKNEEETKKAVDEDGWFHTGDVAQITLDRGHIRIIDRVKNFFKLSQGEYVTPDKIETMYLSANPILSQVYAHGDSNKNFLVGILGVDIPAATTYLTEKLKVPKKSLGSDEDVLRELNKIDNRRALLKYLTKNIKGGLLGFERLHNVYIEVEPLTLEKNLLTPTLKAKRPFVVKHFKKELDRLYEEGSLLNDAKL